QTSGVTGLLLRLAAEPAPSTAESRWIVRAAHSPPDASWSEWGAPRFDAELVRNRHGPTGRWIMEWKCDECLFSETADPQPVAARGRRARRRAARHRGRGVSRGVGCKNIHKRGGASPPGRGGGWGGGSAALMDAKVTPSRLTPSRKSASDFADLPLSGGGEKP